MCAIFPQGNTAIVLMLVHSSRAAPTPTCEGGPHFFATKSRLCIAKRTPAGGADSSELRLDLAAIEPNVVWPIMAIFRRLYDTFFTG